MCIRDRTTDSATKTYSGTALTAGGKVEGIVSGETVEFTTTGSQTEVGTSKNTYELVWKSAKATNYTLAKESIGKLTVKAKSIAVSYTHLRLNLKKQQYN